MPNPKSRFIVVISLCTSLTFSGFGRVTSGQSPDDQWLTVAEKSNYEATCRSAEVVDYVNKCADYADHISRIDFGKSAEGRPMVAAVVAKPPCKPSARDERLRILVIGNIHSGECAGKEALLAMLRKLAWEPNANWLEKAVIIIAPNYNVDANERIGKSHRPGQVGPIAGMGLRENPQGLDLNRDFIKLESPEARSLVSLMQEFDPHMFIDCHTTNGSRHRYALTYDIPHNPSSPQSVRDFLRNRMMPEVTANLESEGVPTFYYGNLSQGNTKWTTYGHEPRYSTEYFGLRGGLGILAEAYSYATYKTRVDASKAFVEQCISYACKSANDIKSLVSVERQSVIKTAASDPNKIIMHLDSRLAPFDDKVTIRGFEGDQPKDFEVTFVGNYEPTKSVAMPFAYLFPKELSLQAERLAMHGLVVEQLNTAIRLPVDVYEINNVRRRSRAFQNHRMVNLEVQQRSEQREMPVGTFVVRTNQPLGRLASYLLEPESNDGLVTWNFLDSWIEESGEFPILRTNQVTEFDAQPVDKFTPGKRLRLQEIYGPDKLDLNGSRAMPKWLRGGKQYLVESSGRRFQVDAESGARQRVQTPFDPQELAQALGEIDGLDRSSINTMMRSGAEIRSTDQKVFLFQRENQYYAFDARQNRAVKLGDDKHAGEIAEVDPAGGKVAFVQNGNLLLVEDVSQKAYAITSDGSESLLNGKLDWVYQEELYGRGNFKGFWWSPDSRFITFLRIDESPVKPYTVTDHLPVRGRHEITPYPKAGDPLPQVKLGLFDLDTKELIWAKLPEGENGDLLISRVGWSPNGENAVIQVQNRQQTWLDLFTVNRKTGDLTKLFRDETPAWIESPGDPTWLDDGSFLWASTRSGYNHIYHYDGSGSLLKQLTDGDWEVRSLLGISPDNQHVFFTGSPQTPTQVQALVVDIDGKNFRSLTPERGTHNVQFNDDFTMFFDQFSTATQPANIKLFRADGTYVRTIAPNIQDVLRHIQMSQPEFVTVRTEDGQSLNAQIIKPPDFDPRKKYPVLVHVYSGPQAPRVRDRFGGATYLWHQYLAQQGYIIWMCDNRSASYHGAKFAWPIHRDLGRKELVDIQAGLHWLTGNPWVDADRIGIWGWSYGGYMTAYAMTHSNTFRIGISGAPVTDWKNYDAIYTERYMDTPQNNPTGYADSSVLSAAKNLHGKLLLIHGTIDDNVHISNSVQLAYELQKAGKQFEMMIYPKSRHSVRDDDQQLHLYQLMTNFILNNL